MGVCLNIIKMTSITILSNIGPDFGKVVGKQEVIDISFVLYVKNPLELNNMITEDYVSFETAKLLKEKGFNECCYGYYYKPKHLSHNTFDITNSELEEDSCSAPTLQMALKWLRKKGFHIFVPLEIDYDEDERGAKWYHDAAYYPEIIRVSDGKIMYDDGSLYAKPEHAYEVAIKYCLENLI